METSLLKRQEKYESLGLTAQPLPIWIGNIDNIQASYININDITYKRESPLKAIDVAIKVYFALNADYPFEAKLPWLLLQQGLYDIAFKSDPKFISLSSILSDIRKHL